MMATEPTHINILFNSRYPKARAPEQR